MGGGGGTVHIDAINDGPFLNSLKLLGQGQGAVPRGRETGEIEFSPVQPTTKFECRFCRVEGAEYEIYIGNFPVPFDEKDLRDLFVEHNIEVGVIRLKHEMEKV